MNLFRITCCIVLVVFASEVNASLILNPIEDAHRLTDRSPPRTANTITMNVVNYAWHVQTYIKFDLSKVSSLSEVTSMSLRLYEVPNGQQGANGGHKDDRIDLYFTNDHGWDETEVDAASVPGHTGQLIDRVQHNSGPNNWLTWDMSSYDLVNNSVDDMLSLVLLSSDTSNGWNMTTFISKDNEQSEFWPQLVLEGNVFLIPEPCPIMLCLVGGVSSLGLRKSNR